MLILFHPITPLTGNIENLKELWDFPQIMIYLRERVAFPVLELYIEHPSTKKTTKKVIVGIILLCILLFGFILPLAYSIEFTTASPRLFSMTYNWVFGGRRIHTFGWVQHMPNEELRRFQFYERLDGSTKKSQYVHLIKKDTPE